MFHVFSRRRKYILLCPSDKCGIKFMTLFWHHINSKWARCRCWMCAIGLLFGVFSLPLFRLLAKHFIFHNPQICVRLVYDGTWHIEMLYRLECYIKFKFKSKGLFHFNVHVPLLYVETLSSSSTAAAATEKTDNSIPFQFVLVYCTRNKNSFSFSLRGLISFSFTPAASFV